ncbi:hypothetical protein ABPG77_005092 [Micractinium sp. CCAP 211/92]
MCGAGACSRFPVANVRSADAPAPRGSLAWRQRGIRLRPAAAGGSADAAVAHAAAAAASAGRDGAREVAVLGGEDFILSQRSGVEEELFKGQVLGVDADVAGIEFRQTGVRSLSQLPAGLEPPPRFLERVSVHYARNLLAGAGVLKGPVPLVMGIWGPKGAGKTFSLELCLRRMGVMPVCLSAGELEDEWAGEPGRRLRERYAFAARHTETTGEPTCLVISDFDAGVGTFKNTFNTVNTQNLQGSLMALCDDPLAVSTGQAWVGVRPRTRVPIYITANDLTCLYAPLVREGRMDKFYYEPTRGEMAAALRALFEPELDAAGVEALLDAFPSQPMDFFGAVKSRMADRSVRQWLAAAAERGQSLDNALLSGSGAPPSMIAFEASLAAALAAGAELAAEQQAVLDIRLSVEYMKGLDSETQEDMEVWRQQWQQAREEREARRRAAAEAAEVVREAAAAAVRQAAAERAAAAAAEAAATAAAGGPSVEQQHGQEEEQEEEAEQAAAQAATPSGLPACTPDELAVALRDRSVVAIDVRSVRDWDWGRINGAAHAPYVVTSGSSLAPEVRPNPDFLQAAAKALGPPGAARPAVLYGPGAPLDADTSASFVSKEAFVSIAPNGTGQVDGEDIVAAAARALQAAGYSALSELAGGYRAWDLQYRPDGRRRAKGAFRDKSSGDLEWWTASN